MMEKISDFEIMAPVGSRESLAAAIQAGADSVYFGIGQLNMRSHSANHFNIEDLREIAATCNGHGIKTYLTVNTIIYGEDIETMHEIVDAAKEADITAIIASDVAVMTYCNRVGVEVHLSTQLNISNIEALKFYASLPTWWCWHANSTWTRWRRFTVRLWNRTSAAARTTRAHRNVLSRRALTEEKKDAWDERLATVFNRGFWDGYYQGQTLGEWNHNYGSNATEKKVYVGRGVKYFSKLGVAEFTVDAAEFSVGDKLLITGPTTGVIYLDATEIRYDLKPVPTAHQGEHISIPVPDKIRPSDKLFKLVKTEEGND
jgi:collagenase-like PrtC family protease